MCLGARECNWERISRVALGDPDLRRRLQRMLCGGGASRPGALGGISPAWKLLGSKASGNLPGPRGIEPSRDPDFTDDGAIAFFAELGLELEGEAPVEGRWVDRVVGLDGVRVEIAMMRTPDGHGRLELTKFHSPTAVSAEPKNAPANTLGIRRIMFAVEDIDDVVARLHAHGAELVGEVARYEDRYRLCYVPGADGIIVALAEQLS